jgi:two-component system, NtrC family, sensor kinase
MAAKDTQDWPTGFSGDQERDFPYFRRLWKSIVVALLAASFIPMLVIGGGMYYYTVSIIEERTLDVLRMEVEEHRNAIDAFLAERASDLRLLSANLGLEYLTAPGYLEKVFRSLQAELPCFTDLSIIDDEGTHRAYVGPFDLLSKNYKEAPWFKAVKEHDIYVSDIFEGFRKEPHFVIAVKQPLGEGFWIIRATVDTAYFDRMVTEVLSHRKGDAFIVNRQGVYQTSPRSSGRLMGQSELKDLQPFDGVLLEQVRGEILVMAWQQKVPWVCVARFDREEINGALRNARYLAIYACVLGGILIVGTVLLSANYLFSRLERKRRSIRVLDHHLQQSSKVASSMHLAAGIIQEMNDVLSNIDTVTSWLQDMSQRNLTKEENLQEMRESLSQIQAEVSRARKTTEKFSRATRRTVPVVREINMNDLLDEILDLLDRELHFNRITVKRDYLDSIPPVRSDPSQLRQVFQNLVLNAVTAIRREGQITLTTREGVRGVRVTVGDTGPGIPKERIERIFDPVYAATPDGTGLGLSIGVGILKKLGGGISVTSEPGKGAVFTVDIPSQFEIQTP